MVVRSCYLCAYLRPEADDRRLVGKFRIEPLENKLKYYLELKMESYVMET